MVAGMDELTTTRKHAQRQEAESPVSQRQFLDLIKRITVEFTDQRTKLSALRRRVEQLEAQGGKP
jgi:polyhydroxyalkanoate synthesis regulator phasin